MNDRPLVDQDAGVLCLGAGYHAVETVNPDGSRGFWILDPDDDSREEPITIPAHELLGPLPPAVLLRLRQVHPRCGRPRKDGEPCEIYVAHPGTACHHHRARATS